MNPRWDKLRGRWSIVKSLFGFLWKERLWWMIPMVGILLVLGALLLFAQNSAVAPFIYTLF